MGVATVSTFDGADAVREDRRAAAVWMEENGYLLGPEEAELIVIEMARAFKNVEPIDLPAKLELFFGSPYNALAAAELPPIVVRDGLDREPVYDNDVSDEDEDAWAARKVRELEKLARLRRRTRFGLSVYLMNRMEYTRLWEWGKTKYTVLFYRNQLEERDGRWFPCGPRTSWTEGHSDIERYRAHRLLYPVTAPAQINTLWMARKPRPHVQPFAWAPPRPKPWNCPDPEQVRFWESLSEHPDKPPTFLTLYLSRLLFMRDGSPIDPYDDTKTAVHFIEPDGRVDSSEYPLTVGRRLRLLGRIRSRAGRRWVVRYAKPWELHRPSDASRNGLPE